MLVDTGSAVSILPRARSFIPLSFLSPAPGITLRDAQGNTISNIGKCTLPFSIKSLRRSFSWSFLLADVVTPILGADFLSHHKLIIDMGRRSILDSLSQISAIGDPFVGAISVFASTCNINPLPFDGEFAFLTDPPDFTYISHSTRHSIDTGACTPVCHRARPLSAAKLADAKAEFDKLLSIGIIRRSTSSWASPLHMVRKANGEWRPCGDYRALNKATTTDRYPVPNITMFAHGLQNATVFSKIDLVKAYHQIPMAEADIQKTAIVTPFGLFEYLRMPFGLKNSAATFQRFIDSTLTDLPHVYAFVDDLLIASTSREEHETDLRQLFQRLSDHGLRVAGDKCSFFQSSITFLGYNISAAGISPPIDRIDTLASIPPPIDFRQVRSILGMFGYYQRFIPNFAHIISPIRNLKSPFRWNEDCQKSYEQLKTALRSAMTLQFPDRSINEYSITTDASDKAIGACLHQVRGGQSYPIDLYSRKLSDTEQRYSVFEKELLAIVASLKKWKNTISGCHLTVFTDHKPIVGAFQSAKERFSDRQQRHFCIIHEYVADIVHIAGSSNVVADTLSRVCQIQCDPFDLQSIANQQTPELLAEFSQPLKQYALGPSSSIWCDMNTDFPRPVVPESLRFAVFNELHNLAHPGVKNSVSLVRDRYVWPSMAKDIKSWCKTCERCQQSKTTRHTKSIPGRFREATSRFQMVHMDIVGPLPPASDGSCYVLTMIDRSSRWMEVVPLKSIVAEQVAFAFYSHWVARFGVPLELITDQGRQFESKLFKELSMFIGFHRLRTSPYHPQSNGLLERFHRTLKSSLRAKCRKTGDWLLALPSVVLSWRATPQENGLTPFTMVTGAQVLMPDQVIAPTVPLSVPFIQDLAESLREQFVSPRPGLVSPGQHQAFSSNLLANCDKVWLRVDRIKRPLEAPYEGPFDVVTKGKKVWTLRKLDGFDFTVSVDRLKPYISPAPSDARSTATFSTCSVVRSHKRVSFSLVPFLISV